MRTVLFWFHLVAALVAGLVIVVMSVTGVALTYEKQMTAWADGYALVPPANPAPASAEAVLAAAAASRPGQAPSAVTISADPARPAAVSFGREATVFVNPHDATVLGEGSKRARAFFHAMTDWHRWLAMEGAGRATGRALTGASNLLFLGIVLSGLVLWWPKPWTPAAVKSILLFRGGLSGKARDFNWHNVIGFWTAVPLALVVASAVTISYPWATDLLYRMAGSEPPPRPTGAGGPGGRGGPGAEQRQARPPSFDGLDAVLRAAQAQEPGWQTLTLRMSGPTTTVAVDRSTGAQRPDLRSTLTFDRATAALTKTETYESQSRGRQWRTWARWLHTGEAFGVPGQTVAGLVTLGSLVLAWTGLALTWRRFRAWRARRNRAPERAVIEGRPVDAAQA